MAGALGVLENKVSNLQVCGCLCIVDRCNRFIGGDIDELIAKLGTQHEQRKQKGHT
jgi:hypothetical protein